MRSEAGISSSASNLVWMAEKAVLAIEHFVFPVRALRAELIHPGATLYYSLPAMVAYSTCWIRLMVGHIGATTRLFYQAVSQKPYRGHLRMQRMVVLVV